MLNGFKGLFLEESTECNAKSSPNFHVRPMTFLLLYSPTSTLTKIKNQWVRSNKSAYHQFFQFGKIFFPLKTVTKRQKPTKIELGKGY